MRRFWPKWMRVESKWKHNVTSNLDTGITSDHDTPVNVAIHEVRQKNIFEAVILE